MTVLNNLEERTIFQFRQIKINQLLAANHLFEFKPSREYSRVMLMCHQTMILFTLLFECVLGSLGEIY